MLVSPPCPPPRPTRPGAGWPSCWGRSVGLLPLFLEPPGALPVAAWRLVGVTAWMVVWWLSEAVPIPATALLPIPLLPLFAVAPEKEVAASYAHPLIFLFLGGFLLAGGLQRSGLHRRVALGIVRRMGSTPAGLIGGFMVATALLSMWISNTATAILMFTIAMALIGSLGESVARFRAIRRWKGDPAAPRPDHPRTPAASPHFGRALMLGIAYSASIGGTATLIGTPTNALLASFLSKTYGFTLSFRSWLLFGVPYTVVMLPVAWLWLTKVAFPLRGVDLGDARRVLAGEAARLGRPSRGERAVAVVFVLTALGWIFREPVVHLTGLALSDTTVALVGGLTLLVVPLSLAEGRFALDWKTVEEMPWGVLILFGGGLSLAGAFESSGLAAALGHAFSALGQVPPWLLVVLAATAVALLTELTSNTATAATFLPIVAAAAIGLGESPLLLTVPITMAASAAFMLPVATPPNAIVFAYPELRISDMAKSGTMLDLFAVVVISLLVLLLGGPVLGIAPHVVPAWAR